MKYTVTFEKRMEGTSGSVLAVRVIGILAAVLVTVVILLLAGQPFDKVGEILDTVFISTFFTKYGIMDTLAKAIPLILASTGVAVAFRMKLWNIGAEGQICMGSFAAAGLCMLVGDSLPAYVLQPLMLAVAIAAGALWGLVAAIPRALWGVNETIITLMLNYVAQLWLQYLTNGPWRDPAANGFPIAPEISRAGWFYRFGDTPIHMGLVLGIVVVLVYALLFTKSKWGYEVKAIGESQPAARYAGMNVKLKVLAVMAVSAGMVGLAGVSELAGATHRLESSISSGYGFTAVTIAWLARLSPTGIVAMSIFMAGTLVGGIYVKIMGLPDSLATMIQGTILFCVLGFDLLTRYKIRLVNKTQEVAKS